MRTPPVNRSHTLHRMHIEGRKRAQEAAGDKKPSDTQLAHTPTARRGDDCAAETKVDMRDTDLSPASAVFISPTDSSLPRLHLTNADKYKTSANAVFIVPVDTALKSPHTNSTHTRVRTHTRTEESRACAFCV